MAKVPVDKIRDVISSGKDASAQRDESVRVAVFVDPATPEPLAAAVRDAFMPELPTGLIHVERLEPTGRVVPNRGTDIAVVVSGGGDELVRKAVVALLEAGIPTAVAAESALDAPRAETLEAARAGIPYIVASGTTPQAMLDRLAAWIVRVSDKDLAFAANFPFMRRAKAEQLIRSCAAQNAAIGAVQIIPGADLPVMTANQAKLALDIACVYGRDVSPARVPELVGVIGSAFGLRTVARELVGLVPVGGWALKAGVGYSGTLALGAALIGRFEVADGISEQEGPAWSVISGVRSAAEKIKPLVIRAKGGTSSSTAVAVSGADGTNA